MIITIGIVNYNTKNFLERCIKSILDNPPSFNHQVVIFDNNSTDNSRVYLDELNNKRIEVILNNKNIGYGPACNIIALKSNADYLLFLNSDVIVKKGAIDKLLEYMEKNMNVAVAGGRILNSDGTLQLSCRRFPSIIMTVFGRESLLRKIFPYNPISREYMLTNLDYESIQKPDWIRGAVMLCRKEHFDKIGGFDGEFFLYLEDTDLCYRLRKEGYSIAYIPDAVFYHELGGSTEKNWFKNKLIHNLSMFRYIRKHRNYNIIILGLILIALFLRLSFLAGFWIIKRSIS